MVDCHDIYLNDKLKFYGQAPSLKLVKFKNNHKNKRFEKNFSCEIKSQVIMDLKQQISKYSLKIDRLSKHVFKFSLSSNLLHICLRSRGYLLTQILIILFINNIHLKNYEAI
ncbi:hypothetical protein BpHYR1_010606 [Brachionus plicatilis]|uniref:Uncharacterized protein n=1 Tax=Brachionus plicatilis TaxID=10195 RepID=A0A3M7S6Z1_BRAPC|nr:hypothetical protein BpHYR1_010606 [Brachionus plicatilis]